MTYPRRRPAKSAGTTAKRRATQRFQRALAEILRSELKQASRRRVEEILSPERAHGLVRDLAPHALSEKVLADVAVAVHRTLLKELRSTRGSAADLLGADITARIESLFEADLFPDEAGEEMVKHVLRQEFVSKLLTEVVHTSIVSFYKRVNPLFGGLATAVLDDQIRAFIKMFMPMIQEQAIRFAVGKRNQAFARDLARSLSLDLLRTPIAQLLPKQSPLQRKQVEDLVREVGADRRLHAHAHSFLVIVWDAVYASIRDRVMGELIDLDQLATPLADSAADLLAALIALPALNEFLLRELPSPPKTSPPPLRKTAPPARAARTRTKRPR